MKRLLALAAAALFLLLAGQALASYYVPKPHHACKTGYVRKVVRLRPERRHHKIVRRHGKVVWVKQARCYRALKRYQAKVDPTFTQAPSDPLAVTYAYSADATLTSQNGTTDLAATGQLPAGVLNFYSASTPGGPEQLYCSINVGAALIGGSCPVTYTQTGTYAVTTEYVPNSASAVTETDQETISPYSTTTSLAVTPGACGASDCHYTLTNTVKDQNGNAVGLQVALLIGPSTGQQPEGELVPANGSCTVDVTASWVTSTDCNFQAGSGLYDAASWSVSASYGGQPGWASSTSQPVTLSP